MHPVAKVLDPAVLAIGHDVQRQFVSLRRAFAWPVRGRGVLVVPVLVAGVLAMWFAATMGAVFWRGALPDMLAHVVSGMGAAPMGAALALFLAGSVLALVVGWLLGALVMWLTGRAAPAPLQGRTEQP